MITERFAAKEARRLFTLPFAPNTAEAQRPLIQEYSRLLSEHLKTEAHCTAIIDWLVKHSARCPPPVEVMAAIQSVEVPDKAKAPLGCDQCHGSGYVRYTRLVKLLAAACEVDFAHPCDCALGRFIQPEYERRRNRAPGTAQDLG